MSDVHPNPGIFSSIWINTIFPNTLSLLACIWFFVSFYQLPRKKIGLQMVLILSISDCVYHFSSLVTFLHIENSFFKLLMDFALYFSTVWPAAIAYLIYNSLIDASLDPKIYLKKSLTITGVISITIKFIVNSLSTKSEFLASFILPLLLTMTTGLSTFCYFKSIKLIRSLAKSQRNPSSSVTIRNLVFYSLVQFITILPSTAHNFLSTNYIKGHQLAQNICQFLLFMMGFINILVYFVLKNAGKKEIGATQYKGSYISLEATLISSNRS